MKIIKNIKENKNKNIAKKQERMPVGASIARPNSKEYAIANVGATLIARGPLKNYLNKEHKQAGITLIALIITIIILLILASITINLSVGERGIFNTAKKAVENYKDAEERELAELNNFEQEMKNTIDRLGNLESSNDDDIVAPKVELGQKATDKATIDGKDGTYRNPTIPKEYYPVNTEEAKWDTVGGAQYDNGLVITDSVDALGNPNGNEWVWVPVTSSELAGMYETLNEGIDITGARNLNVKTNKYSKSEIISGQMRGLPNDTSSCREPTLVVGIGTEYDAAYENRVNYANYPTAGFNSLTNMAESMVSEYSNMLDSIEKYGGFYIGRYELTANGEKAGATLTNTNWYNLYAKCKTLAKTNSDTTTRMIWGCQWDVTCNWIAKNPKFSITNSSSWGNYYHTVVKSSDGNTTIKAYKDAQKLETGITTFTRAKNIYDIAGNCMEWTQEAGETFYRVSRGGDYGVGSASYPASDRDRYHGKPGESGNDHLRLSCYFNVKPIINRKSTVNIKLIEHVIINTCSYILFKCN